MSRGVSRWRELAADMAAAKTSIALILLLAMVELALSLAGGIERVPEVYSGFGLSRAGMADGKVWQLVTYGLLHGGWLHLSLNAVALLAIGSRLERIGGFPLWWKVLLSGLLGGGLLHLMLGGSGVGAPCLVGASGAVVAAVLWLTGVSPGSRAWGIPLSGSSLGCGILISAAWLTAMNPALGIPVLAGWGGRLDAASRDLLGVSTFGASHACHLGGAMVGFAGARWSLRPRVTLEKLQRQRRRREGA